MKFLHTLSRLFGQSSPKIYHYESASLFHSDIHPLAQLLIDSRWEEFETGFTRFPAGDRHLLLTGLGNLYLDETALREWVDSGSYTACVLNGSMKMTQAWIVRGASRGFEVGGDAFEQFYGLLDEAAEFLLMADELRPDDAEAAARMIRVSMGLQTDPDRYHEFFDQTSRSASPHLGAGFYMVDAISAKWGGDNQNMLAFAREQSVSTPMFLSLVPLAHIEKWFYLETFDNDQSAADNYFRDEAVRREIIDCYQRQCEHKISDYFDILARSVWALALVQTGEDDAARNELQYLGPRCANKPWDYIDGNTLNGIDAVRKQLNMEPVVLQDSARE